MVTVQRLVHPCGLKLLQPKSSGVSLSFLRHATKAKSLSGTNTLALVSLKGNWSAPRTFSALFYSRTHFLGGWVKAGRWCVHVPSGSLSPSGFPQPLPTWLGDPTRTRAPRAEMGLLSSLYATVQPQLLLAPALCSVPSGPCHAHLPVCPGRHRHPHLLSSGQCPAALREAWGKWGGYQLNAAKLRIR